MKPMSPHPSFLRRTALALMAHAAAVLPPSRAPWAEAMSHELSEINSDVEALTWAAGCVLASYVERSRVLTFMDTWYVRAFLALLIGSQVLSMLFATILTVAYRRHYLGIAAFLGSFTPGDDYRRFIPLMEVPNWWLHGLWVSASVLFFASGWELLRKRRSAFPLFAAAWVLGTVGNLISQSSPVYRQVFSFPTPMFTRDYLIPAATALLPVFIAAALWAHDRCSLAEGSTR
jgi:hypothetical protein